MTTLARADSPPPLPRVTGSGNPPTVGWVLLLFLGISPPSSALAAPCDALTQITEEKALELLQTLRREWHTLPYTLRRRVDPYQEDVIQDVLLSVLMYHRTFDPSKGTLEAWLYSLLRNHAFRTSRLKSKEALDDGPGHTAAQVDHRENPPDFSVSEVQVSPEGRGRFDPNAYMSGAALEAPGLTPVRRRALELHLKGVPGPEAAQIMGIKIGAYKVALHRARKAVVAHLGPAMGADLQELR